jgi:hypothetical protein
VSRTLTRLNPIKHPGRVLTLLGGASMGALMLEAHNSEYTDPDGVPSIDRVSVNDKKNYFIILTDETYRSSDGVVRHRYLKIPKSHAAKLIYNPIEAAVRPGSADPM